MVNALMVFLYEKIILVLALINFKNKITDMAV